jgi:DNA helicase-2/ATP-dependent DNA helicase PcrA
MTRAKSQLYLTHAQTRRLHGKDSYPAPSRFIAEIPQELLEEVRMRATVARAAASFPAATGYEAEPLPGLRLGQHVLHAKFGEGVVLNYEGRGEQARVQVNFRQAGSKWLMVAYAHLQAV